MHALSCALSQQLLFIAISIHTESSNFFLTLVNIYALDLKPSIQ